MSLRRSGNSARHVRIRPTFVPALDGDPDRDRIDAVLANARAPRTEQDTASLHEHRFKDWRPSEAGGVVQVCSKKKCSAYRVVDGAGTVVIANLGHLQEATR